MRLIPNSLGSGGRGASLREFNPCHDPKDGRFGDKGSADCGPGSPEDAGRQRAIYGQQVDDSKALQFDQDEADRASRAIAGGDSDSASSSAKDRIALMLGPALAKHGDALEALAYDSRLGGFTQRYTPPSQGAPDPMAASTKAKYEKGVGEVLPDPESYSVLDKYDEYKDSEQTDHSDKPSPDDAKDDYDTYREEAEQEANDAAYSAAQDEGAQEYERKGEALIDEKEEAYGEAAEAFKVARLAALDDMEAKGYGDVTDHPVLPGVQFDPKDSKGRDSYTQQEILSQWDEDGEDAFFLHNKTFLLKHETLEDASGAAGGFDRDEVLEGTEFDPNDDEAKDRFMEDFTQDVESDYSEVKDFDNWYENEYGISPDDYDSSNTGQVEDFDTWYENKYGASPSQYGQTGKESFDSWYVRQYGVEPKKWSVDAGKAAATMDALSKNVASSLVEAWAGSSSDGNVKSVALQIAAEQAFGLGATYSKSLLNGGVYSEAKKLYEAHKPVLDDFVKTMHAQTQEWLEKKDIASDDGYVTLYRGWAARKEQEPGIETLNPTRGDVVDVLLQPMSSFSSKFDTALGFASSGGADSPMIMAMRVPVSKIIGSARTGYGCLNEEEFVILGGRYPAFVVSKRALDERYKKSSVVSSQDYFHKLAALHKPKDRQDPNPVRGERL